MQLFLLIKKGEKGVTIKKSDQFFTMFKNIIKTDRTLFVALYRHSALCDK